MSADQVDDLRATLRMAADAQPWPDAVLISTAGMPSQAVTSALAAVRDRSHFG